MKEIASILYTDGKKVLLLRRSKDAPNGKTWDLPGGRIEDEKAKKTAERESEEEIGAIKGKKVKEIETNGQMIYVYSVTNPFRIKDLSKEHDKFEWVDINKVHKYDLHPKLEKNWDKCKDFISKLKYSFAEWLYRRI